MNLLTLAERACLEAGYNDTDDLAAAKKFARHWDEHIWNAALWKDSLIACDITVAPATNEDHAEGIVYLPEVVDRVVAVRSAVNGVRIQGREYFYQMDYDSFVAEGNPWNYNLLPPAWLKWRTASVHDRLVLTGSAADADVAVRIVWVDGTGRRTITNTTVGAVESIYPTDTVEMTILSAFKAASTADVLFKSAGVTGDPTLLGTFTAAATAAPSYARIWLQPVPVDEVALKVLGKSKYLELDLDQQEPSLRNATLPLLAFIRGSLRRRGGENSVAQLDFQEANALLTELKGLEALQAANNQRFLPDQGYGPDYGIGPG